MTLSYGIANKIIVIDPGHGGFDPGAWRGDVLEKDITLQISKKLAERLSQAGAMVILLRETDCALIPEGDDEAVGGLKHQDLANRVKKANEARADLFISIHANADLSPKWSGAQTFYNSKSEQSKALAEAIQEELIRILGNTNRKVKTGNYYVLEHTEMPAVIVEVGFISNPREARLLTSSEYQSKLAYAIFSGIVKSQAQNMNDN
ncbi:MAG: N-acetylmuramoyl-L-alanine amidase CwlD [Syntrophomonadaceae bacterium]|nr:N-acetylmuramoyl-L-alanine amidase CwlD [Syntrophomonadaceae bacterium]